MWKLIPYNRYGQRAQLVAPFELEQEINDLLSVAWPQLDQARRRPRYVMETYTEDGNFVVRVELPGVKKDDLQLTVTGNVLTLKGSWRKKESCKEGEACAEESWSRSVELPPEADTKKITATHEDGVLTIVLPHREEAKPREIKIN